MQQDQLSKREREVAALIARGRTNAEIALSLGLSTSTVKHYVETAMRKAGVTAREDRNAISLSSSFSSAIATTRPSFLSSNRRPYRAQSSALPSKREG